MAAGELVDVHVQPLARDARLEFFREESIVLSYHHLGRHFRPGFEAAGLREDDLRFWTLVTFAVTGDVFGDIMEEVRLQIEFLAVALAPGGARTRLQRTRMSPPIAGCLAGVRDHRVD